MNQIEEKQVEVPLETPIEAPVEVVPEIVVREETERVVQPEEGWYGTGRSEEE